MLPELEIGLRFEDPAHPGAAWEVVQFDAPGPTYIYSRRISDGRLYHHDSEGWEWAWAKGHLVAASEDE